MKNKCDILNLEWGTRSRDTNITEPVLCYLELYEHLNIVRSSYRSYLWKLFYYKPKMLIVSNHIGAPENTLLVRQAYALGIKVVSLISEGDVKNENVAETFFWGWNFERQKYVDLLLVWTERCRQIFIKNIPQATDFNIKVSGATGFDRYQICAFLSKEKFLKKYNKKSYDRVVGLASWGFQNITLESKIATGETMYSLQDRKYLLDTRDRINQSYRSLIEKHPDTLFVLKYHPACIGKEEKTEFAGLANYPNTLSIVTEENVADVINASDIWVAFESTTCLEAWLLNKQTIFFNPTGGAFLRADIIKGSPEITNYEDLEKAYESFYLTGKIPGFEGKEPVRNQLIQHIIGYADGKNHQRAAKEIMKVWEKENHASKRTTTLKKEKWKQLILEAKWWAIDNTFLHRLGGVPTQQRIAQMDLYRNVDRMEERKKYMQALKDFYEAEK